MTQEELKVIIASDENYRIERTISTSDMDKFQEAICAFANDLSGSRKKGYLLIGVKDNGQISGLHITDDLAKKIAAIRSDGNILPLPIMSTEVVSFPDGDVLVVEVTPSFDTPIRYRGRTFVRIGPRRDIATREEERILSERCAASLPTFDTRPCKEATIDDLDIDLIQKEYMPRAIDAEVLATDTRSFTDQLASLHLWNLQWNCPTYAAILMFGKRTQYFLPSSYVQYVHFKGKTNGGEILNERMFDGNLLTILPKLENFIRDGIVTRRPIPVSILREKDVNNYPYKALRELMMNAVMHRDYQSNMPTRLYQYDDRIEISNPGGLYGNARPENFPHINDYRNNVVAQVMKSFNYVNKFNHGVIEVMEQCCENGNPPVEFNTGLVTAFLVKIVDASTLDSPELTIQNIEKNTNLLQTCTELIPQLKPQVKSLIISINGKEVSLAELQLKPLLKPIYISKTRTFLKKDAIMPAMKLKLIAFTHPDSPNHPQQKYRLTELGLAVLEQIKKETDN